MCIFNFKDLNFPKGGFTVNVPNLLTVFRIFLVPVYLYVFFSNLQNKLLVSGLIFILAGITDLLDGYIARKYDLVTDLGAILDPFADKMMTFAVLISFTYGGLIPSWILIALGIKEILLILGGGILYLFKGNQVLPSNKYGKLATVSFYAATLSVVFKLGDIASKGLFLITVVLNILAFINYLLIYLKIRDNKAS